MRSAKRTTQPGRPMSGNRYYQLLSASQSQLDNTPSQLIDKAIGYAEDVLDHVIDWAPTAVPQYLAELGFWQYQQDRYQEWDRYQEEQ